MEYLYYLVEPRQPDTTFMYGYLQISLHFHSKIHYMLKAWVLPTYNCSKANFLTLNFSISLHGCENSHSYLKPDDPRWAGHRGSGWGRS